MTWIGSFLVIYGTWKVSSQQRAGLLIGALGCLVWAFHAALTNQPDLFFIYILLPAIKIRGYFLWSKFTAK